MTDAVPRLSAALADRYTIERELGAGGMATVYLAHDVRHDRKVALKVLRPELAAILGGERFLAEIKTTANLQHPHILPLHDSGEADGLVFYVMPYVEGESVRDRLGREKQLPVEDAVRIAREVASALDYAHRHSVVHRDIKPENILLHDGQALVADFGIALAASRSDGGTRMTETGMSLGTPHYMAPEQAMGEREITPKADIYALGCVLYEMLTGEPPFTGPTAQAIIARVMTEQPRSLTLQRHTVPAHLEAVVRKALEKLPADRFASAAQFVEALDKPGSLGLTLPSLAETPVGAPAAPGGKRRWRALVPWLLLAAAVAGGASGWLRREPVPADPVARFTVPLPTSARLINPGGGTVTMSPNGARIVYVGQNESGQRMLFLRSLDRLEPVPVPGTLGAGQPFFSHDGQWVGFVVGNRMQKVALAGGPPLTIATVDSGFLGAAWGPEDLIVFGTNVGLRRVPAAGGVPAVLTTTDTLEVFHALPDFAPAELVVFHIRGRDAVDRLAAVRLTTGETTRLEQTGSNPHYIGTGHLLYANSDGTIMAAPFDARRGAISGAVVPVAEGVLIGQGGFAKMGVSRGGAMAHATGVGGVRHVVLVDRRGVVNVLTAEQRAYGSPRFSPDGRRIAVDIAEGTGSSLWVFDIGQRTLTRLTTDRDANRPLWTPDGRRIAFTVNTPEPNLFWIAADGSTPMESLLTAPGRQLADGWSPDGRRLIYHQNNIGTTRNDIMVLGLDSGRTTQALIATQADEFSPAVSPDGRWIAYASDESGRVEVYVRAFPAPGGKAQVSLDGGTEPVWSRDGRELFYRNGDRMMVAAVRLSPAFSVAQRTELFRSAFPSNPFHAQYDVAPGGRHFVLTQGPQTSSDLVVVLNWFDQLRAPAAGR